MNCRRTYAVFILLCLLNPSLFSQRFEEGLPMISNYNSSRMGGGEQNWCVTQDGRGMLYVANDQGVLEYDGSRWRIISLPGEPEIRSLVTGNQGVVYVGANAEFGYLTPDRSGTMQYRSLSDSINREEQPFSYIWRSYASGEQIFFCSTEYIFVYDTGTKSLSSIKTTENAFFSFLIDSTLYLSDYELGLQKLVNEGFVPVPGGDFFKEKSISGMCRYKDQQLLIGTFSSGLYLFNLETGAVDPTFPAPGVNEQINNITHIVQLGESFVISSLSSGVFIMNMKGVITQTLVRSNGLLNESVPYLYLNRQDGGVGALWIPNFSGVSKLFPKYPVRIFSGRSGGRPDFGGAQGGGSSQRNRTITGIQEFQGRLFVASSRGLSTLDITPRGPQFTPVEGLQNLPVQDLQLFRPETGSEFLIASASNTIFLIDKDLNIQNLNEIMDLPVGNSGNRENYFNTVLATDPIHSNRIYIATRQITGLEYKNGSWTRFLNIEDFSQRTVLKLDVDQHGYLWASTFDGIKRINISDTAQVEIQSYGPISSSSSNAREKTILDPDSNEIMIASGKGFYRYSPSEDAFYYDSLYNQAFPKGDLQISAFYKDAFGIFWYSFQDEDNEWIRLGMRKSGNRMEVVYDKPFRVLDNAPVEIFYRFNRDALWFAQSDRLYRYNTSPDWTIDTSSYHTLIRSVVVNGDSLIYNGTSIQMSGTINDRPSIEHKKNNLQFTWAALYYDQEFRNHYSYKLDGFDKEWSGWERSTEKEYTNLPAGSYTMRVRSQNVYGIEGEPDAYTFSIAPPWYLAWWSITLYVIFLTVIILLTLNYNRNLRRRTQVLERKNREIELQKQALEQLNEEITSQRDEIETQRDSMAQQKDLINQQNNAITDSIIYARRIQDAVLPAREVMRYLLPKHLVFYRPRDIVSGDFYWIDKKDETVLLVVADCTGHGVPGAFMSMLGISLLNEISSSFTSHSTNEIMDELRDRVIDALGQTGDKYEARDGMEMGFLAINTKTREIQFTGANLNLFAFIKGELVVVKGDRMPVGIHYEAGTPFTFQKLKLGRGDTLYLFSDGYPDQFGGENRKKFGTRRLKKLLSELQQRIMLDQQSALEEAFDQWKGTQEQIDDVLMVGIKL
jgi:serine phosphatase RsbU (regulator of sigma subunit)